MTPDQQKAFDAAVQAITTDATEHSHKRPKITTLLEEFAELVLSLRDKHEHTPRTELVHFITIIFIGLIVLCGYLLFQASGWQIAAYIFFILYCLLMIAVLNCPYKPQNSLPPNFPGGMYME